MAAEATRRFRLEHPNPSGLALEEPVEPKEGGLQRRDGSQGQGA
jgi:hypothetical protein